MDFFVKQWDEGSGEFIPVWPRRRESPKRVIRSGLINSRPDRRVEAQSSCAFESDGATCEISKVCQF